MRFEYDEVGRIIESPSEGGTPRFVLGRAQEGVIWRFSAHLSTELVQDVARLAAREMGNPFDSKNLHPPERWVMIERKFSAAINESNGERSEIEMRHEWVSHEGIRVGELFLIL
jgi:hypothetical protein